MKWQLSWQRWSEYRLLMRLDKPIGIYLLLWPTWWALWLASGGFPAISMLLVFSMGVVLMRSAGCVINDYADRNVDGQVARTAMRPLARGSVSAAEALQLFAVLVALSASLLLWLNWQTMLLSLVALLLAAIYPFMKRYTHLPQVVLGAAFSWGMPMAFMAIQEQLPALVWCLYLANLCWTVAYDTYYAMVDKPDDVKAGIKSTAILFGNHVLTIIVLLQLSTLLLLGYVGVLAQLSLVYYVALVCSSLVFLYQFRLAVQSRAGCFQAFLNNHYVGLLVFSGIALHYYSSGG
ncbi:MAG: 4-hydroxybenzoate octaprenyltransferase [Rheinheimera sp.]|uniref:4-hydroxybenzoate octaprenyltransferase n=1 Tax=Arsukibacterium sp. UBA3155 TaxID=1946058 RepID=UPI000C978E4C|nr:4-hydroxybenzoate octaprenyltransferase [Arsukibacterium sp. UBA3155]MAD75790.1 4-hydroxybenzoate octaprenyltransferase [Rheinheimera sp.]|tara:strand:- start:28912 stop:29787 length:876 start_codon:yes stop_codon:yes gene_type:complete